MQEQREKEPIINNSTENRSEEKKKQDGKTRIKEEIKNQTDSVKEAYEYAKDDITQEAEIGGKKFLFTDSYYGKKILAFVEDERKWKVRAFHYSGSDSQWKAFPGTVGNKNLKGEHYVQSGKLHKDVYKKLNNIPIYRGGLGVEPKHFLPKKPTETFGGRFWEEFEFEEKEQELQKGDWKNFQEYCKKTFRSYEILNNSSKGLLSPEGDFYDMIENTSIEEIKNIKDAINEACRDDEVKKTLKEKSLYELGKNENPEIRSLVEKYKNNTTSYIEKKFQKPLPEDMMPDFSSEPHDCYTKEGISYGEDIHIEEYKIKNEEGDELIFAMAYDDLGRVYIDNIYDPRVGISSYGTMNEIVNMGYLIYKPEDYSDQACGILEKYKILSIPNKERYHDINQLWRDNVPVIKEFKEKLEREEKI